MRRALSRALQARRHLCVSGGRGGDGSKQPWKRESIADELERKRREEETRRMAEWTTSWVMAPWEKAHMNAPAEPLSVSHRLYWRVFSVFGSVGLVYELYVVRNTGVFTGDKKIEEHDLQVRDGYADDAFVEHHLLTDEQLSRSMEKEH